MEEFVENAIDKYAGVIIYFTAPWCGPCKSISPLFKEQKELHKNYLSENNIKSAKKSVKFIKINVDKEDGELDKMFSVESLPTVIFILNGKEVKRIETASEKKFIRYTEYIINHISN